jgi:hypothetical protein
MPSRREVLDMVDPFSSIDPSSISAAMGRGGSIPPARPPTTGAIPPQPVNPLNSMAQVAQANMLMPRATTAAQPSFLGRFGGAIAAGAGAYAVLNAVGSAAAQSTSHQAGLMGTMGDPFAMRKMQIENTKAQIGNWTLGIGRIGAEIGDWYTGDSVKAARDEALYKQALMNKDTNYTMETRAMGLRAANLPDGTLAGQAGKLIYQRAQQRRELDRNYDELSTKRIHEITLLKAAGKNKEAAELEYRYQRQDATSYKEEKDLLDQGYNKQRTNLFKHYNWDTELIRTGTVAAKGQERVSGLLAQNRTFAAGEAGFTGEREMAERAYQDATRQIEGTSPDELRRVNELVEQRNLKFKDIQNRQTAHRRNFEQYQTHFATQVEAQRMQLGGFGLAGTLASIESNRKYEVFQNPESAFLVNQKYDTERDAAKIQSARNRISIGLGTEQITSRTGVQKLLNKGQYMSA